MSGVEVIKPAQFNGSIVAATADVAGDIKGVMSVVVSLNAAVNADAPRPDLSNFIGFTSVLTVLCGVGGGINAGRQLEIAKKTHNVSKQFFWRVRIARATVQIAAGLSAIPRQIVSLLAQTNGAMKETARIFDKLASAFSAASISCIVIMTAMNVVEKIPIAYNLYREKDPLKKRDYLLAVCGEKNIKGHRADIEKIFGKELLHAFETDGKFDIALLEKQLFDGLLSDLLMLCMCALSIALSIAACVGGMGIPALAMIVLTLALNLYWTYIDGKLLYDALQAASPAKYDKLILTAAGIMLMTMSIAGTVLGGSFASKIVTGGMGLAMAGVHAYVLRRRK